jgi:glutathione S-transferase
MAESMPTLYQAEWCPFSSAVREVLTELGVDFVACQVEPWPEERNELRAVAGTDQIPVLQTEDGRLYRGTREIFTHLHDRDPWRFEAAHRRRSNDTPSTSSLWPRPTATAELRKPGAWDEVAAAQPKRPELGVG